MHHVLYGLEVFLDLVVVGVNVCVEYCSRTGLHKGELLATYKLASCKLDSVLCTILHSGGSIFFPFFSLCLSEFFFIFIFFSIMLKVKFYNSQVD